MNIKDFCSSIENKLPDGEKVKSFSVYNLPYDGYNEVYVEVVSGKRFRAMANTLAPFTEFVEVKFPGQEAR